MEEFIGTLRDDIALEVLKIILTTPDMRRVISDRFISAPVGGWSLADHYAIASYEVADAMLKARESQREKATA